MSMWIYRLIAPLLAALLLAACAPAAMPSPTTTPVPPAAPPPTIAPTTAPTAVPAAQPTVAPTTAPAAAAPRPTTAASPAGTRLVKHYKGETEIPANPQRIAVLDNTLVYNLITVGVTPGAMPGSAAPAFGVYRELLPAPIDPARIPTVGDYGSEPDLERLAAIRPDLILGTNEHEKLYERLSRIAPTVLLERGPNAAWQQRFDAQMAVLGLDKEAEAVRQRYRQVIAGLPQSARTTKVAFGRLAPTGGQYFLDSTPEAFAGSVAISAGLPLVTVPEGAGQVAAAGFVTLSQERLDLLEPAGLIVVADRRLEGRAEGDLAGFERNPLWERLPAVRAGRVVSLVGAAYNGGNYIAAEMLLRAIAEALRTEASAPLRLQPLSGTALGAPAVPAPSPGGPDATSYASVIQAYQKLGTAAAPGVFPRTIRHAMGETVIRAKPQRVVVLDSTELETAAQMGIRVVGYAQQAGQVLADHAKQAVAQADIIGTIAEPDLEKIAALRPDLILSNKGRHGQIYEKLAAIAPTVFGEFGGIAWRQNFELYARALGSEEAAAATVRAYEERVRRLNVLLPTPRPSVSLVRVRSNGFRYYLRVNFAAQLLEDLGFPRPATQNVDDILADRVSAERLRDYNQDAGLIVAAFDGGADTEANRKVRQDPLWTSLPAIQKGQLLIVDTELWFAGVGYLGANAVIDELVTFLAINEPGR